VPLPEALDPIRILGEVAGEGEAVGEGPEVVAAGQDAHRDQGRRGEGLGMPGVAEFLEDAVEVAEQAQGEAFQGHEAAAHAVDSLAHAVARKLGGIEATRAIDDRAAQRTQASQDPLGELRDPGCRLRGGVVRHLELEPRSLVEEPKVGRSPEMADLLLDLLLGHLVRRWHQRDGEGRQLEAVPLEPLDERSQRTDGPRRDELLVGDVELELRLELQ